MSLETQNSWDESKVGELAKELTKTYKFSNTYGKPLDLEDRVEFWRTVLEDEYGVDDVLSGLKEYNKGPDNDMPTPSDIKSILDFRKPKKDPVCL